MMPKSLMMKLDMIQPSQLYICAEKLKAVMQTLKAKPESMEPIPIKKLGNEIIFVDGHTRAFAAYLRGETEVKVYWEDEELDWEAYAICVEWCEKEGIRTIADLKNRIVNEKEYRELWLNRCEEMQRGLKLKSEKF